MFSLLNEVEKFTCKDQLVGTSKPRIEGFVTRQLKDLIEYYVAERKKSGQHLSLSRALEEGCEAYFGIGQERIKKLLKLAHADNRSPSIYIQLLLKRALDEIEEPK